MAALDSALAPARCLTFRRLCGTYRAARRSRRRKVSHGRSPGIPGAADEAGQIVLKYADKHDRPTDGSTRPIRTVRCLPPRASAIPRAGFSGSCRTLNGLSQPFIIRGGRGRTAKTLPRKARACGSSACSRGPGLNELRQRSGCVIRIEPDVLGSQVPRPEANPGVPSGEQQAKVDVPVSS